MDSSVEHKKRQMSNNKTYRTAIGIVSFIKQVLAEIKN
jgi:hypothetical protein